MQTASDGEKALQTAHTFRPDVVLLDIGAPDIDGKAVAQALCAQHWGEESDRIRYRYRYRDARSGNLGRGAA
ncbi:hypothetical protein [Cupriavidus sp. D39]|uniref:hypothetical protein n=1 Tax=Cupriavidus sp. D39 TaxID=2997877 RepID=UPI003B641BE1